MNIETDELFFDNENRKHQLLVAKHLMTFSQKLLDRAKEHDNSKFSKEERPYFVKMARKLKKLTFGTKEYKEALKELKPALDHHYANNKHHPEFNNINGFSFSTLNDCIRSMDLIDIVEMLCDWLAATQKHDDGDIFRSIKINEKRYGINDQLSQVFRNTIGLLEK